MNGQDVRAGAYLALRVLGLEKGRASAIADAVVRQVSGAGAEPQGRAEPGASSTLEDEVKGVHASSDVEAKVTTVAPSKAKAGPGRPPKVRR